MSLEFTYKCEKCVLPGSYQGSKNINLGKEEEEEETGGGGGAEEEKEEEAVSKQQLLNLELSHLPFHHSPEDVL